MVVGCSKDSASTAKGAKVRAAGGGASRIDDSAGGSVDLGNTSYTVAPLSAIGAVSGTIRLAGAGTGDSTQSAKGVAKQVANQGAKRAANQVAIRVSDGAGAPTALGVKDQAVCGASASSTAPTATKTGGLSSAIVWIANVKSGKPLPADRRDDLSSEKCLLDPRVQAAVIGTTFNVFNDDKLLHRLVFLRLGTHDTLTVMPFFNSGQVVASERLAKTSGIVEVRCAQHPWTRAYIAVFDHPYYAVTEDDGTFKIDSLPPGTYKLMVWHEGMAAAVEQQVQVAAGGVGKADVVVKIGE